MSSICILATPARVVSAAVSSETARSELCASVSTPGLRRRSSGVRLADEDPPAPSRGEGDSAATDVTEDEATEATVSAAGDRRRGDRCCENGWKRGASGIVGDS